MTEARTGRRIKMSVKFMAPPAIDRSEPGLRRPSAEILQSIARGLRISAETLYVRAGILDAAPAGDRANVDAIGAIAADPTINDRQKQALVEIYRSFQAENAPRDAEAVLTALINAGEAAFVCGELATAT